MAEIKFEILAGLPPYGPLAEPFSRSGVERHSEGFVVRFFSDAERSWVGYGMRNLSPNGLILNSEAWSAPGDYWCTFALDLVTGEFSGGCYPFPE